MVRGINIFRELFKAMNLPRLNAKELVEKTRMIFQL